MRHSIIKSIWIAGLITIGFSCADESLDPTQFDKVKKGTLLALRGTQLDAIYWDGGPYGDAFFPNQVVGSDSFDFDAEFLSEDPSSLESVDIFVIKRTWSDAEKKHVETRLPLKSIPSSAFQTTDDYRGPWVSISIPLTDILTTVGASVATQAGIDTIYSAYADGFGIESDLNLKGGVQITPDLLVAAGLYESDQFYPAQKLIYGVEDIDDAKTKATTTLRGQYIKVGSTVTRTVLPLKNGAMDTLNIVFDQTIVTPPTVSVAPVGSGTIGSVVAYPASDNDDPKDDGIDNNEFYVVFTAGALYTGDASITISGATSTVAGGPLTQVTKVAKIAVDNLAPQNISFTTGTRLGKGQSATVTVKFNEALGIAPFSAVPLITIAPGTTGIDGVTEQKMTVSADGLTATYTYEYKDLNGDATHGDATVTIIGGVDKAGNALAAITTKTLTVDIGAAPAPTIVLDGTKYDWGTQIKWTLNYATVGSNPGGSTSGTVYYVAQAAGAAPPTGFVGGDVPAFIMASGIAAQQTGTVAVTAGTSGSVYSAFAPNGNLDVYVVFVSSTGVISAISAPTNVMMN